MKRIPNFSKYAVTVDGRVLSFQWKRTNNKRRDRTLCQKTDRDGYKIVRIVGDDGTMIDQKVHRLIARTFLGKCPRNHVVNHKNGIKSDNRVRNIEYVTQRDNCAHAYRTGLRTGVPRHRNAATKLLDVSELLLRGEQGMKHREIAKLFGLHPVHVGRLLRAHGITRYRPRTDLE